MGCRISMATPEFRRDCQTARGFPEISFLPSEPLFQKIAETV
jgi:hypothetical protein